MNEIIKASVHKDDYPNPQVGDRCNDDELGSLTLVEVTVFGNGFDLTYRTRGTPSLISFPYCTGGANLKPL